MVGLWIAVNGVASHLGAAPVDPPPFVWLTSFLTLAALVTTTVVLFAQNRQAKLENQRAHLDLQVNLLTEQKVTKLIHLIEELRHDLPMVRDRHDPEAVALQQRTEVSASPGPIGGFGANHHLRQSLVTLNVPAMPQPEMYLGRADKLFDASGKLIDDSARKMFHDFMVAFAAWITANAK